MNAMRHVMILASAGSGKTYALTNRFVALLARGAAPERIVALTFTRKAAGEFFDEILNKLARAARDADFARQLARDIERPDCTPADFLRLLRTVVDVMPRLRLGTLDSFFARIVRAFPLELGLAGEFEILQEHAARLERERVLRRLFLHSLGGIGEAQRNFIEDFKRATFGTEEKRLGRRLDAFIDRHQQTYLDAPAAEVWGNPARIWPEGNPRLAPKAERGPAIQALREWLVRAAPADKQRERWEEFLAALETWEPGAVPSRELAYVLPKALAAWDEIVAGQTVLEFDRRPQELDGPACSGLAAAIRHVVGGELERRLKTTQGIHAVIRAYEEIYHEAVRRGGKLTFPDVQRLLQPVALASGDGAAEDAGSERLLIDFRLDGGIDHWLLDEFQDTSFGQWSVLRNLIDEVVQDAEGRRSFFCVGDVKQAIYSWREGDPRLFREILDHYNAAAPGTIHEEHLVQSWRSGPPLIEMVNAVFGGADTLAQLFPGPAAAAWKNEWRPHVSAVPERTGQAALLFADDVPARWALTLRLLQEIRPLARGLSCAVLVQKNATAAELANFLRQEGGLPAIAESDLHVCTDNPLGAALLALMQAAAHPGDRLAWEHLRMTPLGGLLDAKGLAEPSAFSRRVLGQIHADGFERTLDHWLRRLDPHLGSDAAFSRERGRQLVAAAGLFDETGSRDVSEFVEFMGRHTARDPEGAAVIRVMTVHKSKGLGFDVVFLPDLEGQTLLQRRDGLAVQKAADRSVEWILDLPPKLFREHDPVLEQHVQAAEAEACYEKLSLLYVAMTRAKRAMYVITEHVGTSKSANYPKILAETLGSEYQPVRVGSIFSAGAWARGDSDWHLKIEAPRRRRREGKRSPCSIRQRPCGPRGVPLGALPRSAWAFKPLPPCLASKTPRRILAPQFTPSSAR